MPFMVVLINKSHADTARCTLQCCLFVWHLLDCLIRITRFTSAERNRLGEGIVDRFLELRLVALAGQVAECVHLSWQARELTETGLAF